MSIYNSIADDYDTYRSAIGARDLMSLVEAMGDGLTVLDLGCGTGHPMAARLAPRVSRYLGIDNAQAMLSVFRRNLPQVECLCLDMSEIARLRGGWDLIFSWGALCHLPAEAQVRTLTAAADLLNPGGRLLFTSAEAPGQCTGSVGPYRDIIDHLSLGKAAYTEVLSANGLRLLSAEPWEAGNFTYLYQQRVRQNAPSRARSGRCVRSASILR
jgi:SAM-dependent methyltransferase